MLDGWNKCNFCRWNVRNMCSYNCDNHLLFRPDPNKILAKAKELGISVTDVIALSKFMWGD